MPILTLAAKDARLLLRDPRSAVILLLMPLLLIFVLGLSLGEGFFQKPDDRLRVSVVNLDRGLPENPGPFPPNGRPWSEVVIDDLAQTADIRVERIESLGDARRLVDEGKRAAVLVFGPDFSRNVHAASFLSEAAPEPINPFFRDGIDLKSLDMRALDDPTQAIASSIIRQVAQVTLLRVVLPWMIGKAFDRVGDPKFMESMAREVNVPAFLVKRMGPAVKDAIANLFDRYDLTAKTWAELTRKQPKQPGGGDIATFAGSPGGLLDRGAQRYQILVPSYTVMFAFFLVLTVGWLFVAERRQGTLVRLRLAPVSRATLILGKFLPCLAVGVFQGLFLLTAGWLIFGMSWGPRPLLVLPVVGCTAFAAMGLAMVVAAVAKTEGQVAVYGTLLVLVMAGMSGVMMPRDLMPEAMKRLSQLTPHAWALDAYSRLLTSPEPAAAAVWRACGVLSGFGAGSLAVAWGLLRLR